MRRVPERKLETELTQAHEGIQAHLRGLKVRLSHRELA